MSLAVPDVPAAAGHLAAYRASRDSSPLEARTLLAIQPASTFTFGGTEADTGWDITTNDDGGYYVAGPSVPARRDRTCWESTKPPVR